MSIMRLFPHRVVGCLLFTLLMVGVPTAPPTPAEAASSNSAAAKKVRKLISKVIKLKNPKKTYSKLSKSEKALIKKELTGGARKTRVLGGTSANAQAVPRSTSNCWSKAVESSRWGGITKAKLLSVTNTTRVCVSGGVVTQVAIPEALQQVHSAALGWRKSAVEKSALSVGWEGRGVVRGDFTWEPVAGTSCLRSSAARCG